MPYTVFYFILNMSIASCFVITTLLLIRKIRLLPRRVVYLLWILAFFRLIIPFTFPTKWSLFNLTSGLVKRLITIGTVTQGSAAIPDTGDLSMMNMVGTAKQYIPIEYKTESLRHVYTTISVIWVYITAIIFLIVIILYLITFFKLKKAVHFKDNLYRSDMLVSPLIIGFIHPKIIFPDSLNPDSIEDRMILAHEDVHKSQLDNLWRLIGICIACLHWFNPLVWIILKAFLTDMELSCDEKVIRKYNTEERKAYAGTLLRFAEDKRLLVSTAFGRSGVKIRIVNVLNYKKLTLIGIVVSLLFLLAAALILITNPQLSM